MMVIHDSFLFLLCSILKPLLCFSSSLKHLTFNKKDSYYQFTFWFVVKTSSPKLTHNIFLYVQYRYFQYTKPMIKFSNCLNSAPAMLASLLGSSEASKDDYTDDSCSQGHYTTDAFQSTTVFTLVQPLYYASTHFTPNEDTALYRNTLHSIYHTTQHIKLYSNHLHHTALNLTTLYCTAQHLRQPHQNTINYTVQHHNIVYFNNTAPNTTTRYKTAPHFTSLPNTTP